MRYLRLKRRHKFQNRLVNFVFGCKVPLLLLSAFERKHTQLEIDDDVLKRNFNTASVLLCNFITNEFPVDVYFGFIV